MSRRHPLRGRLLAWAALALLHGLACAAPAPDMPWSRWMLDGHARPAEVLERWSASAPEDRKSTRLNSSHSQQSRMPSSA